MKRNLFVIGAAVAVLMFVACNQPIEIDGDVSLAANRPGAPSGVTVTQNGLAGNSAETMISWTIGENSGDDWEFFFRRDANSTPISASDLGLSNDFQSWYVEVGTAAWKTVGTAPNDTTGWIKDALTTANVNKRYITFSSTRPTSEAWKVGGWQIGIRDASTFDSVNDAESDFDWSTGAAVTFTAIP